MPDAAAGRSGGRTNGLAPGAARRRSGAERAAAGARYTARPAGTGSASHGSATVSSAGTGTHGRPWHGAEGSAPRLRAPAVSDALEGVPQRAAGAAPGNGEGRLGRRYWGDGGIEERCPPGGVRSLATRGLAAAGAELPAAPAPGERRGETCPACSTAVLALAH